MKLSILTCTVNTRVYNFLPNLITHLSYQAQDKPVQILYLGDNKTMSVGEKRNELIKLAQGEYISFIDDDDKVTDDYIDEILKATYATPSVICFKAYRHHDGRKDREVFYDAKFKKDRDLPNKYERIPNHLMAWRKELTVPFLNINYGEDAIWAKEMLPKIQSQVKINRVLYHYQFDTQLTETQKNFFNT